MTTNEKSNQILRNIIHRCNDNQRVVLETDMGSNTVTVYLDAQHTHCGYPNCSIDELIDSLYDLLVHNRGLNLC